MTNPVDDVPTPAPDTTASPDGVTGDSDRSHAEDPAEGEGDGGREVPRVHSEDPAEG